MTFVPFCGYYVFVASLQQRLPENVPGDFFVDSTCIDCDTCSQLAPTIFRDHGDQCSVYHQPETDTETQLAMMALVSCPTGSIGATERHDAHLGIDAFPMLLEENVYFCGFTSESSFGAWSYLITRPASEGGNILIDSPTVCEPTRETDRSDGRRQTNAADAQRRRCGLTNCFARGSTANE